MSPSQFRTDKGTQQILHTKITHKKNPIKFQWIYKYVHILKLKCLIFMTVEKLGKICKTPAPLLLVSSCQMMNYMYTQPANTKYSCSLG